LVFLRFGGHGDLQLETELAVSRKVNEIFLDQDLAPEASSR
jgi:hypothetical protein